MNNIKSEISQILENEQLDEMPKVLKTAGRAIKKFLSRSKLSPWASEEDLLKSFGAKNVISIPITEKYSKIFGEGEAYPDFIFVDSDPKGVYLGCYFATSKTIINIDKKFKQERVAIVKG